MEMVAQQLDERMEAVRIYDLPNLVREIKKGLLRELDFSREARHMKIFQKNLAGEEGFYIPRLFDTYSTSQILTMELVEGTSSRIFSRAHRLTANSWQNGGSGSR